VSDFGYGLSSDGMYFCSSNAPTQFKCTCGTAGVCNTLNDPWGRDIGSCECCPVWVWVILGIFGVLFVIAVVVIIYACCLRDKWWFDGFPRPIQPILPRRGPPVVAPVGMPLPRDLFRGYRISDFIAGEVEAARQLSGGGGEPSEHSPDDEQHHAVGVGGTPTSVRRRAPVSFSRLQAVPLTAPTNRPPPTRITPSPAAQTPASNRMSPNSNPSPRSQSESVASALSSPTQTLRQFTPPLSTLQPRPETSEPHVVPSQPMDHADASASSLSTRANIVVAAPTPPRAVSQPPSVVITSIQPADVDLGML